MRKKANWQRSARVVFCRVSLTYRCVRTQGRALPRTSNRYIIIRTVALGRTDSVPWAARVTTCYNFSKCDRETSGETREKERDHYHYKWLEIG